jgi:serine/threonine-protein kinase
MEEFVDMFLAEARLAARIRHPNVVQPLDVLRIDDEVFLVMEYVEGDSLSRLMKGTISRQEKVPLPIAVAIMSGVLRGLHAAHEAKSDKGEPLELVHRDISPQNVLVGVDGTPRVIDFGIAKAADSVQVTREGELKGKLSYMAPELLSGRRGTRRADIYAAAVVMWEVLTAQRLFDADYQSAILNNILHRPVDRPSDFVDGLPRQLDDVVLKGLARDPSDRFATAREMAQALEEAAAPATASVVGEWVEVIAAVSLAQRGARVADIEARPVEAISEAEPEEIHFEMMPRSSVNPPVPMSMKPPTVPTLQGMGGLPPPPAPPPPSMRASQPVPSPPGGPLTLPSASRDSFAAMGRSQPPPTIVVEEAHSSMGPVSEGPAWPVPGIAPSAMGETVQIGPKKRSSGSGIVMFILIVAAGLALTYVGLPELLKRKCIAAAAQEGVSLSIDSAQIGMRKARLVGVNATLNEVPGVTLHIQSVDLAFSFGLDPTDASAHEPLLSIDGAGTTVRDGMRRWQMGHDLKAALASSLGHVALDAGHLVWTRAFGEGTRIDAENSVVDVARSRDGSWDDVNFASPIVVVTAPWGKVGPWIVTGQGEHGRVRATFSLDPSGASRAAAVVSLDGGSVTAVDMTIPRSNAGLLGISSGLLGRRPDDPLFIEGSVHYAVEGSSRITASLHASLSGARLANAPGETDAQVDAQLAGDPTRPIEVTGGAFAFGPFRGRLGGRVTIASTYVEADVSLRTVGLHCGGAADVVLGGGVQLDTRNLGEARIAVSPSGRCPLKILPL